MLEKDTSHCQPQFDAMEPSSTPGVAASVASSEAMPMAVSSPAAGAAATSASTNNANTNSMLSPQQLSELNAAAAAVKAAEAQRKKEESKTRRAEIRSRTPNVRYGGTSVGGGNIVLGTFPTVAEGERHLEIARLLCKYWKSLGSGINKEGGGYTDGPSHEWVKNELERLGVRTAKKDNKFGKLDKMMMKQKDGEQTDVAGGGDGEPDNGDHAGPARKKRKRDASDESSKSVKKSVAKPIAELPKPLQTYEYEVAFHTKSLGLGLVQPENTISILVDKVNYVTAASLGVLPMDEVIAINGIDVEGKQLGSVAQCLAAFCRRPIRLKFRRCGYLAPTMDIAMPNDMVKAVEEGEQKKRAEESAAKASAAKTMANMAEVEAATKAAAEATAAVASSNSAKEAVTPSTSGDTSTPF